MSCSSILLVLDLGPIRHGEDFPNNYRGKPSIWTALARHYLPIMPNMKASNTVLGLFYQIRDLLENEDYLLPFEKAIFRSTYPYAMLRTNKIEEHCRNLDTFITQYRLQGYHVELWRDYLDCLYTNMMSGTDTDIVAICWSQAPSLSPRVWDGYDISKCNDHFFLYEED